MNTLILHRSPKPLCEHLNLPIRCLLTHSKRVEEQQFVRPNGARPFSRRTIADLSPRLGVLNNIPFAIPFEARVNIFRAFIRNDKHSIGADTRSFFRRTRATVRRGHVAEDGFDKLGDADLKHPIEITFIDQFGEKE